MIVDLHCHTSPRSDDSYLHPRELVRRAREAGVDAVCLTEHDWPWEAEAVRELARETKFIIIPGMEVTTEEGHLLAFGLDRYIFGMHRAEFVRRLVDEAGGALIMAHPYRRQFHANPSRYESDLANAAENGALRVSNAVEVANGRGSDAENAFSAELSRRTLVPGTGGSDAHDAKDVGTYATLFEREVTTVAELVTELKAGRFRPIVLGDKAAPT